MLFKTKEVTPNFGDTIGIIPQIQTLHSFHCPETNGMSSRQIPPSTRKQFMCLKLFFQPPHPSPLKKKKERKKRQKKLERKKERKEERQKERRKERRRRIHVAIITTTPQQHR